MTGQRHYQHLDDLPGRIAVFPLAGVLLLPRAHLPLNVFEPRYLAMVDAVLQGDRLIGMIQPFEDEAQSPKPALAGIGCAGRLTGFRETDDGRYLVTLTGICRFRVAGEFDAPAPFRQVQADFAPFLADLRPPAEDEDAFPRDRLMAALKAYLSSRDLNADWQAVTGAPPEGLVNALCMLCPFEPAEKQALLEAPDWSDRVQTLIALLEMACLARPDGGTLN